MIELERRGDVHVLRMNGGENRFDPASTDELHRALDTVEATSQRRALVTTGAERFYSNGLDIGGFARLDRAEVERCLSRVEHLFARLLAFPGICVAAINGHAFAAGAMLALAHDFRVMRGDRGYVCLPEIDLATGQPLTPGMFALLDSRLERRVLHEMLVTGRRYGGEDARAAGIVHETRPEREVLPRALEIAQELAQKGGRTVAALKRGLFGRALARLESG